MFYRYLATGESFRSLHMTFRVGRSTIPKIVHSTCRAIHEALKERCLPELTKGRLEGIAEGFKSRTTYPHIIGAIDGSHGSHFFYIGKHVNLKAPPKSGTSFFNYKKTFNIVLLATADAQSRFT